MGLRHLVRDGAGAFWLGYRINPLYRAPGMSGTAYMNLFMILYVLYRLVF